MLDLMGSLYNLDVLIFYFINLNLQNPYFNFLMPAITNIGLYIVWFGICVLIAIFGGEKGRNVALILFIAIVLGHFFSEALKILLLRPRPFLVLQGVHQLGSLSSYSFPSGHATTIFIGCIILGKKYGYLVLFLLLALTISFSRIYMGLHYPSDVLGGALLGVVISILVLHFEDHILKLKNWLIHR